MNILDYMVFRIRLGMGGFPSRRHDFELLYYNEYSKNVGWKDIMSPRCRHCINLSGETGPFARKGVEIIAD
jgi:hypothetical protein